MRKKLLSGLGISSLLMTCSLPFTTAAENVNNEQKIRFSDSLVTTMGRTNKLDSGSILAGYPGVTFTTKFSGNSLTLNAQSSSDKTYIEAIIDNQAPQLIKLSTTPTDYKLTVPAGNTHQLTVINRAESWHGLITFNSLTADGKFSPAAKLPTRKILVLGDSVTCASSIDRVPNTKPETSYTNPRLSYGMLIAKGLNAQVQLVCMGGHGLVRTWDGFTDRLNLDEYYALTYPSRDQKVIWDQSQYQPDLIISTIGTNDFTQGIPEHDEYVSAYLKLVFKLLADHKKAQIVLSEGAILHDEKKAALTSYILETVKRTADTRVHYIASNYYPGEPEDAHPTKAEHAKMAQDFIPPLKQLMKW